MTDEKPPGMGRTVVEAVLIAALTAAATGLVNEVIERWKARRKKPKKTGK